jgi:drug/metabolite transporter (DMT)-like permease
MKKFVQFFASLPWCCLIPATNAFVSTLGLSFSLLSSLSEALMPYMAIGFTISIPFAIYSAYALNRDAENILRTKNGDRKFAVNLVMVIFSVGMNFILFFNYLGVFGGDHDGHVHTTTLSDETMMADTSSRRSVRHFICFYFEES